MSDKFNVYRCIDPRKTETTTPWYNIENKCPCDPRQNNITGRGFTPCTFGFEIKQPKGLYNVAVPPLGAVPSSSPLAGSFYQDYQYVPPQLQPRPLSNIGNEWRSAN